MIQRPPISTLTDSRFPYTTLVRSDPAQIPASVTRFAGDQLAIDGSAELMARYCATKGRWRPGPRIRIHYGYRVFSDPGVAFRLHRFLRSEEHTSELQSLMRISSAVFCLKKNTHLILSTHR